MKKSKKTKASKEKKNVKELSQTHGAVEKEKFEPTTLDQIWGDEGLSKYGTLNEDEYVKQIDEFNRTDLQAHAIKLGIVPIDDRSRLTKKLLYEFRIHAVNYKKPADPKSSGAELSKEASKILSEGR